MKRGRRFGRAIGCMVTTAIVGSGLVLGAAVPSAADVPARQRGGIDCTTDGTGQVQVTWQSPLEGVAAVDALFPADVTGADGADVEKVSGWTYFRTTASGHYTIDVTGPPSSPCRVQWAVDAVPANDDISTPEGLAGSNGSVSGSTRATLIDASEPNPTGSSLRAVWYRWTGADGDVTFVATPSHQGGPLDPSDGATNVGVAVYDPADLTAPLAVDGDGVASQEGGGTGGSPTDSASAGVEYLVVVFSAGGTGTAASQYGYTAAGAFTLAWNGANGAPEANDDTVETALDSLVRIDVLANDTDPDGDTLTVTTFDPPSEGTVDVDATNPNLLAYTPPTDFVGVSTFGYDVEDGQGGTDHATVSVYVGVPAPSPSPLTISPSPVDFGPVPHGRTADRVVTITNTSPFPNGPFAFGLSQAEPQPFDVSAPASGCFYATLAPGGSCEQTVRFWSVDSADAASPATLTVFDGATFTALGTTSLTASTAPPVPPGTPNTDPIATDDLSFVLGGVTHTLAVLTNDNDPDADILTVTGTSDPPHGTVTGIVRCADHVGGSLVSPQATCVQYHPAAGFSGIDQFTYTIADGRGGTATGTVRLAVDNPSLQIDAVTPDEGPPEGGQSVQITGDTFLPGAQVTFVCAGVSHSGTVTDVTTTRLTVTTPAMPEGSCDVVVRFPGLGEATLGNGYLVDGSGNRPPVANDDTATVRSTNTVSIPVLANDTDPDGDDIHVVGDTQPAHGRLDATVPDVYEYTPDAGYLGSDEFTYTIADETGATATATVDIDVTEGLGGVRVNMSLGGTGLALGEQACFELHDGTGPIGPARCANAASPTFVFVDVPLGTYSLEVDRLPRRFVAPATVPVEVRRDGLTEIVAVSMPLRELRVGAIGPNGAAAGPMCYRLEPVASASGAPTATTCSFVVFGVHVAQFVDVWDGVSYRLEVTDHPAALMPAAGEDGKMVGPFDTTTVLNSVVVRLIDPPLLTVLRGGAPGACFELEALDGTRRQRCDAADGQNDGTTRFLGQPDGDYVLRETTTPAGRTRIATRMVTVPGEVDVGGHICDACITVRVVDANFLPVGDACLSFPPGVEHGQFFGTSDVEEPIGCQDLDGLISFGYVELLFPLFPTTWPVIVRRSGIPVANRTIVTGSTSIQQLIAPDPVTPDLAVHVAEADGDPVNGACFEVQSTIRCDADDGFADGTTEFPSLPNGAHRLRQTTVPAGTERVAGRSVNIPGDVTLTTERCTACVTVRVLDQAQQPVTDACLSFPVGFDVGSPVQGWPLEEELALGCTDPDGLVSIGFVDDTPVSWDFWGNLRYDAPRPFIFTNPWAVVVRRTGSTVAREVVVNPTVDSAIQDVVLPRPARLTIHSLGEDSSPITGCWDAFRLPQFWGVASCTEVVDTIAGTDLLVQPGTPPAGYVGPRAFEFTPTSVNHEVTVQWPRASVTVHRAGAASPYCVLMTDVASLAPGDFQCSDASGGDVRLLAMSAGTYTIQELNPPAGHGPADTVTVTLVNGEEETVDLVEQASLTLRRGGAPGACFELETAGGTKRQRCDAADGQNDGTTSFLGLPDGDYVLRETTVPTGRTRISTRMVTAPGELDLGGGACDACITVRVVDANQNPVGDACLSFPPGMDHLTLFGVTEVEYPIGCQDLDGLISFGYVEPILPQFPSTWPVIVRRSGIAVANRTIVTGSTSIQQLTAPDPVTPDLTVRVAEADGDAVNGACFEVQSTIRCDADDGFVDGATLFLSFPDGAHRLRQTTVPVGSTRVAGRSVTVPGDITVTSEHCTACVSIRVLDQAQQPVTDACLSFPVGFDVGSPEQGWPLEEELALGCTDPDGLVSAGFVDDTPVSWDFWGNLRYDAPRPFLFTNPWAVVVRRSGSVVATGVVVNPTVDSAIQNVVVPDPARLTIRSIGENGAPIVGCWDATRLQPPSSVIAACGEVVDTIAGVPLRLRPGGSLPAGYVGPREFTFTPTSMTDSLTVQWPRASVAVERTGATGPYCVVLTDTASTAPGDFQCSDASGGDIRLLAMSAGTYTVEEVTPPPGRQPAAPTTITLTNGEEESVQLADAPWHAVVPGPNGAQLVVSSPPGTAITATRPTSTPPMPGGVTLPFGALDFTVSGVAPGATVPVTIDLPGPVSSYWKLVGGVWSQYPNATVAGNRVTVTLTDRTPSSPGAGDDDPAAGVIRDPGAPAVVAARVAHVSSRTDRGGAVALAGATLSGRVAVFVPGTDAQIRSVRFSVDGRRLNDEDDAPFDLGGTERNGTATLLPTRLLRDGAHTLTTRVVLADGRVETRDATFTTSNPRPATRALQVSPSADRTGARALDGASVTGRVAVFVPAEPDLVWVEFYLDGRLAGIELGGPYDYGGTRSGGSAELVRFSRGRHTLTARLVFRDGYTDAVSATFTSG